jgi:hypothetical protein
MLQIFFDPELLTTGAIFSAIATATLVIGLAGIGCYFLSYERLG